MTKLVFGCGYLGLRVAQRWLASGDVVHVVTRNEQRAQQLARKGFQPSVGDVTKAICLPKFERLSTVLYAIGFDRSSGKSIHEVYVEGLTNALSSLTCPPGKILYTSSTGVYGQSNGEWVDEQSPCQPLRAGGLACLAAEQTLLAHPYGQRAITLRLAGIYGPERLPSLRPLLSGDPLEVRGHEYLNLIHVDDAVQVVLAAEGTAAVGSCYTVSDGHPVRRADFYNELARLLGAPKPTFASPAVRSTLASRGGSDKRVSNRRMRSDLGVSLRYPSYRDGLAASIA